MSKTKKSKSTRTDYDGVWKEIIEVFFESFIAQLLPELHPHIDFNVPPEFLDQEMQNIAKPIGNNKRIVDKLIKVRLKDGTEKWILIHVEVQSRFERWIAKRMFYLYSMISLKHDKEVVALVVYTTKKTPLLFDRYEQRAFNTELLYRFNAYKVGDQDESALMASDNPFALFVLANLYILQTGGADKSKQNRRLQLKKKLYELALEKEINLEIIENLLIFVEKIMLLSIDLQAEFNEYLKSITKMTSSTIDWTESRRTVINNLHAMLYGKTHDEFVADLEKEKQEREKERIEREKERMEREKEREKERMEREKERESTVIKLYFENFLTPEQIGSALNMDTVQVDLIISDEKNSTREEQ